MHKGDLAPVVKLEEGSLQVSADIAYKRLGIVNVIFFGSPNAGDREWILIDAGLYGTAPAIKKAAIERFGQGARPAAIILTHGHFDHVGSLVSLAEEWNVRIFAHPKEFPYLDGTSSYPPPDAFAGGTMSLLSPLFPRGPIDVRRNLHPLPDDQTVPGMAEWKWIPTPGHAPGHISLWRESDRTLISGDAVITTRQESAYAVAVQEPELHGPPMYFTPDWNEAKRSVQALADLKPEILIAGHGTPLKGENLRNGLFHLAATFDDIAIPKSLVNAPG